MLPLQTDKKHFHCRDGVGLVTGKVSAIKKHFNNSQEKPLAAFERPNLT